MSRIAEEAEKDIDFAKRFYNTAFKMKNLLDALSHSAVGVAIDINAKMIVVCSRSGSTCRMISRFRAPAYILGMTTDERVWRKLSLSWGVIPLLSEEYPSTDVLLYHATREARATGLLKKGDNVVITAGAVTGGSGNTNLIRIDQIK